MSLPVIACPVCGTRIPLEVWLACTATREAFSALAGLHPSNRLPWTAMRYAALFGPVKQTMRWERIADVLREIGQLISSGRVDWKGTDLPAPLDYWLQGMDTLLAKDDLRRPLANHNYLRAVVAGMSEQSAATSEQKRITGGRGETPIGAPAVPPRPHAGEGRGEGNRAARKPAPVSLAETLKSLNLKQE